MKAAGWLIIARKCHREGFGTRFAHQGGRTSEKPRTDGPSRLMASQPIQKPIGSAFVGGVFRTVREQDVAVDTGAVPAFGAGELPEMYFAEFRCLRHDVPLSFE
jgi:hypothetical protein